MMVAKPTRESTPELWRSRPLDEAPFRGGFHVDANAVYQAHGSQLAQSWLILTILGTPNRKLIWNGWL